MPTLPPPDQVKLPRHSKGKRPSFFDDPAIDQMMTFILELMTEVSVVRDRLDTVERLLETKGSITQQDIEDFVPSEALEIERANRREAYTRRVLRMHQPG